jgi:hypothetical protein
MSPRPSGSAAALVAGLSLACSSEVRQPIAYDHRLHVGKLELECDVCHEGASAGDVAGLPPLSTCATCHQEANGASAEEAKVVAAVRAAREIPWARLYELPRHVYFTHRRHVAVARIDCGRCHGEMRAQARPPPGPLVSLGMDACLECHGARGASRDCATCHR